MSCPFRLTILHKMNIILQKFHVFKRKKSLGLEKEARLSMLSTQMTLCPFINIISFSTMLYTVFIQHNMMMCTTSRDINLKICLWLMTQISLLNSYIPFNVYPCYPFNIVYHGGCSMKYFYVSIYEGKFFDLADVRIIDEIYTAGPFFTSSFYCHKVSRLSSRLLTDALIKIIINNFLVLFMEM